MRVGLLLTTLATAIPTGLWAQSSNIRVGQTIRDSLVRKDQKFSDGSRYKLYAFQGIKGDTVTFDLMSDDFDANLVVADASGNRLSMNDDGGEKCNARLQFVPPSTASFRVYANSSSQAELGDYRISLTKGRARAPADSVCRGFGEVAGMIEVGQTITGTLTSDDPELTSDSTYYQRWILPVRANQAFTVDLQSTDFDAYVWLTRGRGDKILDNDDGGGGCDARLVYTSQDARPLRIVVNTASRPARQTGRFTLKVSAGASPVETKGNCSSSPARSGTRAVLAGSTAASPSVAPAAIRIGSTVNGSLTSNDSLYPDNSYYKIYQFTATGPRDTITIDLASDDFDPVLIIRGDDLDGSITNDDGGPGCSARVSRAFPGRGPYRILVNATADPEKQTGRYSLSITQGAKPVQLTRGDADCQPPQRPTNAAARNAAAADEVRSNTISVGQTQQGRLSRNDVLLTHDSTYAQAWTIQGRAGTTITIDLESDAFDAYLILRGPGISGGRDFQDDDSGGSCNARLTAMFPQNGEYEIVVNTAGKYATGAFSLSVTNGSKPKSVARCNRSQ